MYRQKKFYIFLSILLALFFTSKAFAALTLSSTVLTGDTATTVIGGTTTTSDLTLQTTSGVGATGADIHFLVGNNGATEAVTILNGGNVGIGTTTPSEAVHVVGNIKTSGTVLSDKSLQFPSYVGTAPAATAALAGAGAGNVDNGSHSYRVAFITAEGETPTTASNSVTVTDSTVDGQISVTLPISADSRVTGRRIYRTAAGGTFRFFLADVLNNTDATYLDNLADASLDQSRLGVSSAQNFSSGGLWAGSTKFMWVDSTGQVPAFADGQDAINRWTLVGAGATSGNRLLIASRQTITGMSISSSGGADGSTAAIARISLHDDSDNALIHRRFIITLSNAFASNPLSATLDTSTQMTGGLRIRTSEASAPIVLTVGGQSTTNEIGRLIPGAAGTRRWQFGNDTQGFAIDPLTTADTMIVRNYANTGGGHVQAASLRGTAVAFASLPAAPVEGMLVGVTDSSTATWGDTITGGGANHVLAYYNGTNWTVAGK